MASPFRYFRKHTKAFMAVAVVLLMFIWVVGSSFSSGRSNNGPQVDGQVAAWNGGSLNESQLQALMAQRKITNDFLLGVFGAGGGTSGYDLPRDIPLQGILLTNDQEMDNLDQVVINTEVEAQLAKEAGITVSDQLISQYIKKVGLGKVTDQQAEQILANLGNGNPRTTEGIVFGTLRKALSAYFYTRMYAEAGLVVTPEQRWADWRQVNERISVQAAILPVDKFLTEVPEPTDEQLLGLYNEFRDFDPGRRVDFGGHVVNSPDPGFAEPRRVRLEYLKLSVPTLTEKLLDTITEQDIAYYYEQNKENFVKIGAAPAGESTAPAAETPATETPTTETPAADAPAESTTPAAETPATETPASPAAPAEEAAPAAEPAAPAAEGANESSDARRSSPFRLASFQEESTPAEPAAEAAAPAAAEAATAAPAEEPAAPAADATPATTETPATEPAASATATPSTEQYEPLDAVRDEIRRVLAQEAAEKELIRIMTEATAQLQAEANVYEVATIEAEESGKKPPKPPAKLTDLQWLADKYGLTYEKTSPLTMLELFDTPVGKAIDERQTMNVTQAAFYRLKPYEPMLASELEGDAFIVVKSEDVARRIPDFKEVRDQVVTAWKQRKASELAEKKAQELAAEVVKSNTPFDQFFFADRGYEVIKETALFSWLNYPAGRTDASAQAMLSDVPELKGISPEFMEKAFSLVDNETVSLLNYDHTAAYVLRLARKEFSDDDLKKLFLQEAEYWRGGQDMLVKHASQFQNAVRTEMIQNRAGLEINEEWEIERQKRREKSQ
ncbi:hypothetical protein [Lacipirellula parvula]|uniref:PpiC domain-containing protein n=1 Tax=Lacipirellula parvula TaxID=2650471 RepID=A0A5K7XEJ6_9BACT|nr:hypothetical protein [Lacipirellula parvula]BBO32653.1 hypothetical protein PLANPX_2265 [Lacipirellula parvula]